MKIFGKLFRIGLNTQKIVQEDFNINTDNAKLIIFVMDKLLFKELAIWMLVKRNKK